MHVSINKIITDVDSFEMSVPARSKQPEGDTRTSHISYSRMGNCLECRVEEGSKDEQRRVKFSLTVDSLSRSHLGGTAGVGEQMCVRARACMREIQLACLPPKGETSGGSVILVCRPQRWG